MDKPLKSVDIKQFTVTEIRLFSRSRPVIDFLFAAVNVSTGDSVKTFQIPNKCVFRVYMHSLADAVTAVEGFIVFVPPASDAVDNGH